MLAAALPFPALRAIEQLPPRGTAAPTGEGRSISRLAGRSRPGPAGGRAAVPVRAHPDGVQRRPLPVRRLHRGRHPTQRAPDRGLALWSRHPPRMRSACVRRAWAGSRWSATWLAARGRRSGGHAPPPRRPAEPGGGRPGAAGADGRRGGRLSLVDEGGHQGAAVLIRHVVAGRSAPAGRGRARRRVGRLGPVISEIVADCWSVGTLGLTSTLGLMAVVSLPPFFVFRPSGSDPTPCRTCGCWSAPVSARPSTRTRSGPGSPHLARHVPGRTPGRTAGGAGPDRGRDPAVRRRLVGTGRRPCTGADRRPWPTSARRPERLLARFRAWATTWRSSPGSARRWCSPSSARPRPPGCQPRGRERTAVRTAHRLGGAQQPRPGCAGRRRRRPRSCPGSRPRSRPPRPRPGHS